MTDKYILHTDIVGNCFIAKNNQKYGMFDKLEKEQVLRVIDELNHLHEENIKLKNENEKLKIENQGQSDAIDGLQEMMAHYNLEDLE